MINISDKLIEWLVEEWCVDVDKEQSVQGLFRFLHSGVEFKELPSIAVCLQESWVDICASNSAIYRSNRDIASISVALVIMVADCFDYPSANLGPSSDPPLVVAECGTQVPHRYGKWILSVLVPNISRSGLWAKSVYAVAAAKAIAAAMADTNCIELLDNYCMSEYIQKYSDGTLDANDIVSTRWSKYLVDK